MASTTMLVLVQYDFHYTAKDGRLVSIKPNESYILVCKTNEHWWRVRRDRCSRPFYVPAQYVKEMPNRPASPERGDKLTAVTTQTSSQGALGEGFVFLGDVPEKPEQMVDEEYRSGSLLDSQHPDISELYMKPVPRHRKQSASSLQDHNSKHDDDEDFPQPPDLPPLDPTPEENVPDFEQFELTEPDFKGEPGRQAANGTFSAEASACQVRFSACNNVPIDAFYVVILILKVVITLTGRCRCGAINVRNVHLTVSPFKHSQYSFFAFTTKATCFVI